MTNCLQGMVVVAVVEIVEGRIIALAGVGPLVHLAPCARSDRPTHPQRPTQHQQPRPTGHEKWTRHDRLLRGTAAQQGDDRLFAAQRARVPKGAHGAAILGTISANAYTLRSYPFPKLIASETTCRRVSPASGRRPVIFLKFRTVLADNLGADCMDYDSFNV